MEIFFFYFPKRKLMAFGNRLTESALAFIVRTNLSEHKRDVIKTDDLSELSKEFMIELPSQMKFSQSNKRFSEIEWNSKRKNIRNLLDSLFKANQERTKFICFCCFGIR